MTNKFVGEEERNVGETGISQVSVITLFLSPSFQSVSLPIFLHDKASLLSVYQWRYMFVVYCRSSACRSGYIA